MIGGRVIRLHHRKNFPKASSILKTLMYPFEMHVVNLCFDIKWNLGKS